MNWRFCAPKSATETSNGIEQRNRTTESNNGIEQRNRTTELHKCAAVKSPLGAQTVLGDRHDPIYGV